jgi:hypothetical protein
MPLARVLLPTANQRLNRQDMEKYEAAREVVAQASTILELVEAGNLLAQFTDDEQAAAREYFNSLPDEVHQQFIAELQGAFAQEAAIEIRYQNSEGDPVAAAAAPHPQVEDTVVVTLIVPPDQAISPDYPLPT